MSYIIKLLLSTIGDNLSMEQEIKGKGFLDRFGIDVHKILIKRWIFDNSNQILSWASFWQIFLKILEFGDLCTQIF